MDLIYTPFLLQFKHPFGVSSNTRKETASVFIRLKVNDCEGFGEACLPSYLGETMESVISFFEKSKLILNNYQASFTINEVISEVDLLETENNAAKAAIDIALHDLKAKLNSQSFAQMMQLPLTLGRKTSFTIGIDKEEVLIQKISEAEDFDILKIKVGTADDKALIDLIRKHTGKPLYVDVNQGWTDKEFTIDMINWMNDKNVILVEQPMPAHMKEEMQWVTERSPLPTIADESVKRLKDLEKLETSFSGVNIKLMKCTGLQEALKMIDYCKKNKLIILLGCMAESSCATSAMAQLMRFADYVDLDAPLLYTNDPFSGVRYKGGTIFVNDALGIGAKPITELF